MNIKEYISTGIVESYVLGLVTEAERQEFETLCLQYPELAEARSQFEEIIEKKMISEAVNPPASLKEKIENSIQPSANPAYADMYEEEQAPVRKMFNWKWVAAASIILLAGSLLWAFALMNQKNELHAENEVLKNQVATITKPSDLDKNVPVVLTQPGMHVAGMHTAGQVAPCATVYWDTTSSHVYLMINHLPVPAQDKQYQLWAIIDEKPVDLGVVEPKKEELVLKMKNVRSAKAFAITLEPAGGSVAPTMTAMQVYGEL